jgi:hypothetical protein
MAIKLTWDDLLIQHFPPDQVRQWLDQWTWLVTGDVRPIAMSKFGSWFLERRDGCVAKLDVLEGTMTTIAKSVDEFRAQVNDQAWQEEHLLSLLVYQLHEAGKIPGPNECYAFAPHPAFTGRLDREQVMILSIVVWQSICAQTLRQN